MRTKMTSELVCPYCGAIQDMSEVSIFSIDKSIECEKCDRKFEYDVHVFYSSWKKEEMR